MSPTITRLFSLEPAVLVNLTSRSVQALSVPQSSLKKLKQDSLEFILLQLPPLVDQTALQFMTAHMQIRLNEIMDKLSYDLEDHVLFKMIQSEMHQIFGQYFDRLTSDVTVIPAKKHFDLTPMNSDCLECKLKDARIIEVDNAATIHSDLSDLELGTLAKALSPNSYFEGVEIDDLLEFLIELRTICFENEYCEKQIH